MNYQDAFVLSPISSDEPIDIDKQLRVHELLIQFDELLRKELGLEFRIVDLGGYAYEECQKLIRTKGISSVMSTVRLQEALMPKVSDVRHKYLIVEMLRDRLIDLSPCNEIIIVDGYIFPDNGSCSAADRKDYLQMFEDIFAPIISSVRAFNFVTKPGYNQGLFADFKRLLLGLNPKSSVSCKTTNDFHDRFWIVDRSKGLFVGTSLNGIGKKYALVDVIRDDDTKEIVNVLELLNVV